MKFIRNSKARERVIDIVAKSVLIAFSALVCLWMISGARASGGEITDIQQESLADGGYAVDFLFSKPIAKEDVAVDFQRNFIQLTLKGVSAYPARTTKLNHDAMEKVFTYQYQPDVTRARMLLKTNASVLQPLSSWEVQAQRVRIVVKGSAAAKAAAATTTPTASTTTAVDTVKTRSAAAVDPEEEKARRDLVSGASGATSPATTAATATTAAAATPAASATPAKPVDHESLPLFANHEANARTREASSSGSRVITALLLVIGLIGAGALGFRRFAAGKNLNFMNLNLNLNLQRGPRMIEVVAKESIGAKRSIAIVKVLDQYLVVGLAGDGMSLLQNLGTSVSLDKYFEESNVGNSFAGMLAGVATAPTGTGATAKDPLAAINPEVSNAATARATENGIRSSIKKRLEGFKPL